MYLHSMSISISELCTKQQQSLYKTRPMQATNSCNFGVKIVIIGDSGVGKTNILIRFCDDTFKHNYSSTIGVDFKIKVVDIHQYKLKMQIWDTAGQEKFKNIAPTFYKGSVAIILAYSITDLESFKHVEEWIKQINDNTTSDVVMFLVGNKSDLVNERKVDEQQGKLLAKKYNMGFQEVSAKDSTNIATIFTQIAELLYPRLSKVAEEVRVNGLPAKKGNIILYNLNKHAVSGQMPGCAC